MRWGRSCGGGVAGKDGYIVKGRMHGVVGIGGRGGGGARGKCVSRKKESP